MIGTLLTGSLWLALAGGAADACDAAVLYPSGSEAYQEAVAGIHLALAGTNYQVEFIDQGAPAGKTCLDRTPKLVVAIGINAWTRLAESSRAQTLLPALVLRADMKAETRNHVDAVYADVPLTAIAERLREAFPGKSRLALIHRASHPAPEASVLAHVKQMGLELQVVDCTGPEKLLAVFGSLKGKVDFVLTEPDSELYNSATLKPLVLASLDKQLPIVGFSAAFVRAGALAGVYPDFRELGRQTGEMMLRVLAGKGQHTDEGPRKVVIAVNDRIARLLGLEPSSRSGVLTLR
jgi:hypothetical protein